VPGKTAGKLEVYDTSSGVAVGPWDIAAGGTTFHSSTKDCCYVGSIQLKAYTFRRKWKCRLRFYEI